MQPIIAMLAGNAAGGHAIIDGQDRATWEARMGRFDIAEIDAAGLGAGSAADVFFELGMVYATGRSVPLDLVTAHKWFNIAAMRGNTEATRHRREIATEMSEGEVAAAQRAARDWLQAHQPGHCRQAA